MRCYSNATLMPHAVCPITYDITLVIETIRLLISLLMMVSMFMSCYFCPRLTCIPRPWNRPLPHQLPSVPGSPSDADDECSDQGHTERHLVKPIEPVVFPQSLGESADCANTAESKQDLLKDINDRILLVNRQAREKVITNTPLRDRERVERICTIIGETIANAISQLSTELATNLKSSGIKQDITE